MTEVITQADPTMTTTFDDDTTTTGDSIPATFDDLPDEIRREIMMKRADGQAWDSQYRRHPIWASSYATKKDLIHFCRLAGFQKSFGSFKWTKHALRQQLVSAHDDDYLRHMRQSEQIWQPATFNRDYRTGRAVRAWWSSNYPELAW